MYAVLDAQYRGNKIRLSSDLYEIDTVLPNYETKD